MQKVLRYTIYLSILLFYNLTTLYSAVTHDHDFTWKYEESCSAYVISISQNSDTYPFSSDYISQFSPTEHINFKNNDINVSFENWNTFSERAPPPYIA